MSNGAFTRQLARLFICAAILSLSTQAAADPLPSTSVPMGPGLADKESENLSGAACAPNGPCLLVGDEMRFARLFTLSPSAADPRGVRPGQPLFLLPGTKPDKPETDVEGVAFAGGSFYIVGSHSRNKSGELQPPRHILYRVPAQALAPPSPALGTEATPSTAVQRVSLDAIILAHPFNAEHLLKAPGEGEHGINIEAIAVTGNDMFLGFRGPVTDAGALVLQVDIATLYAGLPQTPRARCLRLPHDGAAANGQGIRDMAAASGGYLILTGREMREKPERTDIYFWVPDRDPVHLGQVDPGSGNPEALMLLEENADSYRVLIMSDGPQGGEPRKLRLPKRVAGPPSPEASCARS